MVQRSVTQVPEPLSPRNRSRVPKLSGAYRSHRVKHEPVFHTRPLQIILGLFWDARDGRSGAAKAQAVDLRLCVGAAGFEPAASAV